MYYFGNSAIIKHSQTESTPCLFWDEMEKDWWAVIAEAVGGGSVFFTPWKRHLFENVSGINIDRQKYTQVLRTIIAHLCRAALLSKI